MTQTKVSEEGLTELNEGLLMQIITVQKKNNPDLAGLALGVLYQRHAADLLVASKGVYRWKIMDPAFTPADIVVEAFLKVFEKSHTYRQDDSSRSEKVQFKNWVSSIIKNIYNRKVNEHKPQRNYPHQQSDLEVVLCSYGSESWTVYQEELFRMIEEEISKMAPLYQEVFALYYMEPRGPGGKVNSFKLKELASRYGITPDAIRQREHRLLKKIKDFYPES